MPELPEVETVSRILEKKIINKKIRDITINYPRMNKTDINSFKDNLINQTFLKFKRRGKYLIFELNDFILVTHLRMEGRFYVSKDLDLKHIHVIFNLGDVNLYYQDFRKFGTMSLYPKDTDIEKILNLGVEALDVSYEYIKSIMNTNKSIKEVLLDQKLIAGIGNIYSDEICFRSKLHPESTCNKLSEKDYENISNQIKSVITDAIEAGGFSVRKYTDSLVSGRFDFENMNIFRDKKYCIKCNTLINKIKVKGRGTYVCNNCQELVK